MDDEITELIKSKRPNISTSSVQTYRSLLKSLYTSISKKTDIPFADFFNTRESDIKAII
jgi:hypothetical protein